MSAPIFLPRGIQAHLTAFRSIDSVKPNSCPPDLDGVAVDHGGTAGSLLCVGWNGEKQKTDKTDKDEVSQVPPERLPKGRYT